MDQAERLRRRILENEEKTQKMQTNARVITVTSGKGGVGKTSISVNLALQFQKMGKRTVIVDADFGLANIEVMLGAHPQNTIADLIGEDMQVEDVLTFGPEGIAFISGGSGISELLRLERSDIQVFISKIAKLDKLFDVIIIDTGAGITDAVQEFVVSSSEVILVITPEPTSTMDAYALLKTIQKREEFIASEKTIHVVTNRVSGEREGQQLFRNINAVSTRFLNVPLSYLGIVPQDTSAVKAIIQQTPVTMSFPNSAASRSLCQIVSKLCDNKAADSDGFRGVFMKLFRTRLHH